MNKIKNILAVVAHPDDLEMMAGGFLLKMKDCGCSVHVLILTNGTWTTPDGVQMRDVHVIDKILDNVKSFMGYESLRRLDIPAQSLSFCDELVCEILKSIKQHKIDTIVTTWDQDVDNDHKIVADVVMAASKLVPRVIMSQVNYYINHFFVPNLFVDITDYWDKKLCAMSKYTDEWDRQGDNWTEFMDISSRYYGKAVNVHRAEGFIARKYLIDC